MKRRLEYLWAKSGSIQVSDLANNFFLVRFASQEDYSLAAFKGPWKVYDYYISVSQWSPSFDEEAPIKSILTWVRLPKLPIHYFNKLAVSRIGDSIGKTVRLDLATAEGTRGRYARVCVEVDVTKPLLGKYMIEDKVLRVEYESLENVCFECGFYGHKKESCTLPEPQRETEVAKGSGPAPESLKVTKEPDIGEWMTVQRRNRKKHTTSPSPVAVTKGNNTFSVLEVEDTEENLAGGGQEDILNKQTEGLRRVLDAAMNETAEARPSNKKEASQVLKMPLSNITNVEIRGGNKKMGGLGTSKKIQTPNSAFETSELVAVPVIYQNIAFQADPPEPMSVKAKQNVARRTTTSKSKGQETPQISLAGKKRVVKKKASSSEQASIATPINSENMIDATKTRKPPDRS
ncbi:hypothetical protein LINPERHAP1_LOCUS17586 [Linum perenne]